ncbi:MAG: septal ring lytic transglycosylase RlpA family protein [Desulfovibrionaceae bacterium]
MKYRFMQIMMLILFLGGCSVGRGGGGGYYDQFSSDANFLKRATADSGKNSSYLPSDKRSNPKSKGSTSKKIPGHYRPYTVFGKRYYPLYSAEGFKEEGLASWYGKDFHGKKTSNGETYNMYAETAAHKTLPMGTIVKVTNVENKKSMVLRINDRGPFVGDRVIDLSYTAAVKLDVLPKGTARVRIDVLKAPQAIKRSHEDNKYYVQVGAFSDEYKASSVKRSISQQGLSTRLIKADNRAVWRVQVGPLKHVQEAENAKAQLAMDFPENYIIMD